MFLFHFQDCQPPKELIIVLQKSAHGQTTLKVCQRVGVSTLVAETFEKCFKWLNALEFAEVLDELYNVQRSLQSWKLRWHTTHSEEQHATVSMV